MIKKYISVNELAENITFKDSEDDSVSIINPKTSVKQETIRKTLKLRYHHSLSLLARLLRSYYSKVEATTESFTEYRNRTYAIQTREKIGEIVRLDEYIESTAKTAPVDEPIWNGIECVCLGLLISGLINLEGNKAGLYKKMSLSPNERRDVYEEMDLESPSVLDQAKLIWLDGLKNDIAITIENIKEIGEGEEVRLLSDLKRDEEDVTIEFKAVMYELYQEKGLETITEELTHFYKACFYCAFPGIDVAEFQAMKTRLCEKTEILTKELKRLNIEKELFALQEELAIGYSLLKYDWLQESESVIDSLLEKLTETSF